MKGVGGKLIPFKQQPTPELILNKIDRLRTFIATTPHRLPTYVHRPTELRIDLIYLREGYGLFVEVLDEELRKRVHEALVARGDDARVRDVHYYIEIYYPDQEPLQSS